MSDRLASDVRAFVLALTLRGTHMADDQPLGTAQARPSGTTYWNEAPAPDVEIPTRIGETAGSTKPVGREVSLRAFLSISVAITGVLENDLPARIEQTLPTGEKQPLYEIFYDRVRAAYPTELVRLLQLWVRLDPSQPDAASKLAAELGKTGDAALALRLAARQIAKIWFLSTIDDPQAALDKEKGTSRSQLGGGLGQYQLAVIFPLIGAPVSGYSNLPHGYWSEQPASFFK